MPSAVAEDVPIPASGAVARLAAGAAVEVRCAKPECRRVLFKIEDEGDLRVQVGRICPGLYQNAACGLLNVGHVTARRGVPLAESLSNRWECARCGSNLGRVHPVKGRLTVLCRCGEKVGVTAADVPRAANPMVPPS